MKTLMVLMLAVAPGLAAVETQEKVELAIPMELDSSAFENDVESVSDKLRRFLWESKKDTYIREINAARNNPAAAQAALDALLKDYPELREREPHAFEYHEGTIRFWQRDFKGAHDSFDTALRSLREKYPDGIPQGGKHARHNAMFMADLYMGRGTTAMFLGRDADAVKDINLAIHFSPSPRPYMQVNRCRALIRLKKYQEASEALDHAFGIDEKWTASVSDRAKICSILAKKSLQPQACRAEQ